MARGSLQATNDPKKWRAILYLGRDAAGKKKQRWVTLHGTKREAETELAKLVAAEAEKDSANVTPRQTVEAYLRYWLAETEGSVAPTTAAGRRDLCVNHLIPQLGSIQLGKLTPLQIQRCYNTLAKSGRKDGAGGLGSATVQQLHRILHRALAQAVRWKVLAHNPASDVDAPNHQREEPEGLTREQSLLLLQCAKGGSLWLPAFLAASTALRKGELLALRWSDLDLDAGRLRVRQAASVSRKADGGYASHVRAPKTHRSKRPVSLSPSVVGVLREEQRRQAVLRAQMEAEGEWLGDDRVLLSREARPWTIHGFNASWARLMKRAEKLGVPRVGFHNLRHSHLTWLMEDGVPTKAVSDRAGHSRTQITQDLYQHVRPEFRDSIAQGLDATLRRIGGLDGAGAAD